MKIKFVTMFMLTLLVSVSAYGAWDISYDKDAPLGSVNANTLDTAIQDHKKGNIERLNVDHFFGASNNDLNNLTSGMHRQVTLYELDSATTTTGFSVIYNSTSDNLHFLSDENGDVQITDGSSLDIDLNPFEATSISVASNLTVAGSSEFAGAVVISGDTTSDGNLSVSTINENLVKDIIVKGWVQFDGSALAIRGSYNVDSVVRASTGRYTVYWDSSFEGANYAVSVTADTAMSYINTTIAAGSVAVNSDDGAGSAQEADDFCVIAVGR